IVTAAVTEAGTGRPRAASPCPTAAPNSGPSSTFCGRIPSSPPRVPVAAPTATGPAPVTRPAAHPSGATSAALVAIRAHSGGISPGRCRARATASQAASAAAPATAPTPAAREPRCPVNAAPATPPMTPATMAGCFRPAGVPRLSAAIPETYRPRALPRHTAGNTSCSSVPPGLARGGSGDAGLVGDHDQLDPVAAVQLGQEPAHVRLDRGHAQVQARGDLGVGHPGGDQREHLALALGELRKHLIARRRYGTWPAGELGDQAPGDARRQQRLSAGDHPDGFEQLLRRCVLEDEPAGPVAQGFEDVLVLVEGGHHEDPGQRVLPAVEDDLGGFQAVHDGHPDVHQHHVGPQGPGLAYRLDPVTGLADDLQIRSGVDQDPESGAHKGLVVGDQHADRVAGGARTAVGLAGHRRRSSAGRRATTAKPPPGRGSAVNWPPSSAARSRIPTMPRPGERGLGWAGPGSPPARAGPGPSSVTVMVSSDGPCATSTSAWAVPACFT